MPEGPGLTRSGALLRFDGAIRNGVHCAYGNP
nr:MAG TPA: hypothetical protein [Caudoviricetes sp.]DAS34426.1 MAG TPA: hypothetical protein [Caudoviricetes sp.]DAV36248.1 MAG TPA: hypothetical protein [Caudoviricetes sp.]